jgi:hypothetical protein
MVWHATIQLATSRLVACILVVLGTTACGPPRIRAHEASPPAPSTSDALVPRSDLRWDRERGSIRCPLTGTTLEVPEGLRGGVRRLGAGTLAMLPEGSTPAGAVLITTAPSTERPDELVKELYADWARLQRVVNPDERNETFQVRDMQVRDHHLSIDYVVPGEPGEPLYRLRYTTFRRHAASCRIAAIARAPFDEAILGALDGVHDSPGLDMRLSPPAPYVDPHWALLRGMLYVGALIGH